MTNDERAGRMPARSVPVNGSEVFPFWVAYTLDEVTANRWTQIEECNVAASEPGVRGQEQGLILVVDDEEILRSTVAYNLRREGYTVIDAIDGVSAIDAARTHHPDLVILDVMLPGIDGLQVCRTIRAESNVPIIMLSAKGEEFDRVLGLEIGADDYLSKPFAMRELLARVRATLRRFRMIAAPPVEDAAVSGSDVVTAAGLVIDLARRTVTLDGEPVALKPKEFDLLTYLARHPGVVLSRDALLREVWGYDFPMDTRTVDVHIRWLRQKLEADPSRPRLIETMRGYGYRIVAGESEPT